MAIQLKTIGMVAMAWLGAACGNTAAATATDATAVVDTVVGADVAADTAQPADTAPASKDASAGDTAPIADAKPPLDTATAPDVTPDVAPPVDAVAAPDTAPGADCATIMAQIAALKPTLQTCSFAKGCQTFEHPICNSAGCFQLPIAADADQSALNALTSAASKLGCAGFTCGCAPQAASYCFNQKCGQCPPDCDGTCEEKGAALNQAAAAAASYCGKDEDCTVIQTGLCPVGDLPCGGIPANKNANADQVKALANAYAPCGAMCKCKVPGPAKCIAGKCKI